MEKRTRRKEEVSEELKKTGGGEGADKGDQKTRTEQQKLPMGWAILSNPWVEKWEHLMIPPEEAERHRRTQLQAKAPFWGETKSRVKKTIAREGYR